MIQTVSHITHTPTKRYKAVLAAAFGACTTLVILLPVLPLSIMWLTRIMGALIMCVIAFYPCPCKRLLQVCLYLFVAAGIFCGVIYTLGSLIAPQGIITANGVLYADVSLSVLLIGTIIGACVTTYTSRKKQQTDMARYRIEITMRDKIHIVHALCDSGNRLYDPFSGLPVIVCDACSLQKDEHIRSAEEVTMQENGFRMLQVNTVTGVRLLPAFTPKAITIFDKDKAYPVQAVIAVSDESIPAVFSPVLLP